jgi:hypothetical protein
MLAVGIVYTMSGFFIILSAVAPAARHSETGNLSNFKYFLIPPAENARVNAS